MFLKNYFKGKKLTRQLIYNFFEKIIKSKRAMVPDPNKMVVDLYHLPHNFKILKTILMVKNLI
jgi:hypothetical protein